MSTVALVQQVASEFTDTDTIELWLPYALGLLPSSRWQSVSYSLAVANLTAHLLTLADPTQRALAGQGAGSAGPATSVKTGDLAVTYAVPDYGTDEWSRWLARTSYGNTVLALASMQPTVMPRLALPFGGAAFDFNT